jgi:hypothetical protein
MTKVPDGEQGSVMQLDRLDLAILGHLQAHGRATSLELSEARPEGRWINSFQPQAPEVCRSRCREGRSIVSPITNTGMATNVSFGAEALTFPPHFRSTPNAI